MARNSEVDEQTPLLGSTNQDPVNQINEAAVVEDNGNAASAHANGGTKQDDSEEKPLPMGQIFVLCLSRMVDPIVFFCIFPFIPKMVETMDVKEEDVGFYTGLIESLASVTQMLTMVGWGRFADRYGRRPTVVISNVAVAVLTVLFGMSRSLWQVILLRCLQGCFTGSIVSVRAMFHEISTPPTRARAFSYFAFAGNLGIFAGPAIGSLARPAAQYPDLFGKIQFFHDWPYVLPTAIAAAVGFIAALTATLFLRETLPEDAMTKDPNKSTMSTWELVRQKDIPITLATFGWAGLLGFAFTAVAPVYFYTSIELGGFGFSEKLISLFIAINGISQALWLLIAFPLLHRRVGTKKLLQGCGIFWPLFMIGFPLDNWFLRQGWKVAFWIVGPTMMVLGSAVAMAFTGVQLAVNDVAPSPELLGTLNGVALTLHSGIRSVTPTLISSVYAAGVKKHILWGQLGILVLAIFAAAFFFFASALPDQAQKSSEQSANDEATGDV